MMFGPTGDHKGWQKFCVLSVDLGVVVAAGRDFDSFGFAYTAQGKKKKKTKAAFVQSGDSFENVSVGMFPKIVSAKRR